MVKKDKSASTEQKILEAARTVFVEKGLAGARMQDIADKAGINKALLHYYFRSKEKLFEVIFLETAQQIFPRLEMAILSDMSFFDKIRSIVSGYIEGISKNPYIPLFIMNEMNKNPEFRLKKIFDKQKPVFIKKFVEEIESNIKKGVIKPVNPAHILMNMFSMCAFPFIAKPVITRMLNLDNTHFTQMMEQRKILVAEFIIDAIKK